MLDVVGLLLVFPVLVELMYLAGYVALLLEIKGLVDLAEAALADECEEQVALVESRMVLEAGMVLVVSFPLPTSHTCATV